MHYSRHRLTASVTIRSRTRQPMTNRLALFANWSICQILNRVSSVQFSYEALCAPLGRLKIDVFDCFIDWQSEGTTTIHVDHHVVDAASSVGPTTSSTTRRRKQPSRRRKHSVTSATVDGLSSSEASSAGVLQVKAEGGSKRRAAQSKSGRHGGATDGKLKTQTSAVRCRFYALLCRHVWDNASFGFNGPPR